MVEAYEPSTSPTSLRAPRIEGGVSRRVVPGDVVVIPGHTPHWWSELESDIEYLIFRPDPDNRLRLR
jgi:quercetin dioxygenase-like cupin family protein